MQTYLSLHWAHKSKGMLSDAAAHFTPAAAQVIGLDKNGYQVNIFLISP